jgi:hypothetical protein
MKTMQQRNVVGVFADGRSARAAVRFLEHAGFAPDVVSVISGNIRQAREMSGSRSIPGALIGAILALVVFVALAAASPEMRMNPVALVFGVAILVIAGIGIGTLAGRSRIFVADHAQPHEDAIEEGETLVAVHVDEDQPDRARRLLREAGAMNVREEETIERA